MIQSRWENIYIKRENKEKVNSKVKAENCDQFNNQVSDGGEKFTHIWRMGHKRKISKKAENGKKLMRNCEIANYNNN